MLTHYRLQRRMHRALGYVPNLRHPRTFNEKLAWRMLHDRNPLFPRTIDKVAVRAYVAARVSSRVLAPLLGVWDQASEITWDMLPDRFALKAAHGWNMNILVRNKASVPRDKALEQAAIWLRYNHYKHTLEWGYRDVPHRILAEELLCDADGALPTELKFHVFNGKARLIRVHQDRYDNHRVTFFNEQMHYLPISQGIADNPNWKPPDNISEYFRIAESLGRGFDYVRVDLYSLRDQPNRVFFSELTHYESNACRPFIPQEFDFLLGEMWQQKSK